jgi:hypothetical protein
MAQIEKTAKLVRLSDMVIRLIGARVLFILPIPTIR